MRARGFLLLMTLWVLTAITLALSSFALWLDRSVADIRALQANTQAAADMLSTRSTLLYWFSTQTFFESHLQLPARDDLGQNADVSTLSDDELMAQLMNPGFMSANDGLKTMTQGSGVYLFLDDRVYQGLGDVRFSVQDAGGLLPLRGINWQQVRRLLAVLGVEAEDAQPLLDKLHDYIDIDDFNRLNGAEAYQYKTLGLPVPTNRLLRTTAEVQAVLDWMLPTDLEQSPKVSVEQHQRWQQLTTINAARGYPNFNTAPLEVLQTLDGVDLKTAELIIEARNRQSLLSERELRYLLGAVLPLDSEYIYFTPSNDMRFSLWYPGAHKMQQWEISLKPMNDKKAPWELHYRLDVALTAKRLAQKAAVLDTPLLAGRGL